MSKRQDILEATESLLWDRGYESTSPGQILARSGAGQGSLYHHFRGKRELAIEAMKQHEDVLLEGALRVLEGPEADPLERVRQWLSMPRDALKGCRLGRLVHEKSVREDAELRAPVERYFERLHELLTGLLEEAAGRHREPIEVEPTELASLLIAAVQGGFVLSQGTAQPAHLDRSLVAARKMLDDTFA